MPLTAGSRVGPYEVVSHLGSGGMGDVYRARDTRLDRTVAIKIIRAGFSERFEREAKSISALNHPHICTLHDVGQTGELAYLVMEYIDGAPIAGPLPAAEVLRIGIQICDALHAAHQAGIVHRDLKPANILAARGGIKLLDFGLAKAQKPSQASEDATLAALTGAHTIVGTPQDMAPEQIEGRDADARADIFALGCVLYEFLTGRRAFEGKTVSSVMAAILATEPRKPSELVPMTPPELEWVILRCLSKDPDARWQSARDVGLQLQWIGEHPRAAAAGGAPRSGRRELLAGIAAGLLVSALAAGAWIWSRARAPSQAAGSSGPVALTAPAPSKIAIADPHEGAGIALAPDGRMVAFVGNAPEGPSALYIRRLDQFDAVKVAGTEDGMTPFFSPDGRWLGFSAGGKLKRVPVEGGAAVDICDAPALRGSVWLADDTIAFSPLPTGGLMRVPANGGTPVPLTTLDAAQNERTHRTLIGLPGGKAVVFVIGSTEIDSYDDGRIVALALDTGKVTELAKGYSPVFSRTGHLLYVRRGTVFAMPFDPATLQPGGLPVPVLTDVATQPDYGTASFAVSADGTLAYVPGGNRSDRMDLRWVDRAGNTQPIKVEQGNYATLRISPDGRRLAFMLVHANNALLTYDLERDRMDRITNRLDAQSPTWTPDGAGLTYWTGSDVRSIAIDGTRKEEVLISAADAAGRGMLPVAWSSDGQTLALTVAQRKGADVAVYSRRDRKIRPVVDTRFDERAADLSPDGRWLVYVSDETGRDELYLHDLSTGTKTTVSDRGASFARWTKDGRELVFKSAGRPFAMTFSPGPPPVLGKAEELMVQAKAGALAEAVGGDVAPDGSRFAVLFDAPRPPLTEIRIVTNWAQQLAQHWR